MRHRKKFNHLGRKSAHRKETLSSLATSLILHKRITTTLAKAKALRVFVEPLITKSKVDSTHSRRVVFGYLRSKEAVSELFRDVAQKSAERPGGYTRILKTGFRKGDSAEMCFIELVDYNTNMLKTEEDTRQKTTRRGSRRRKAADAATASSQTTVAAKKAEAADEVVEEQVDVVADETTAELEEQVEATAEETTAELEEQVEAAAEETTAELEEQVEAVEKNPDAEVVASAQIESDADSSVDDSDQDDAAEAENKQ